MEKIAISMARVNSSPKTTICITRYGNVMGSRGSVIPVFENKIKKKQSLNITDPNMTRFMMTLDEAVKLVLHAFKKGNRGDIYIQKSPACDIITLAKAISKLHNVELKYNIIGTRHGEKNHEVLINKEEMAVAIEEENYFRIPYDNRDIYYNKYLDEGEIKINEVKEYRSNNTFMMGVEETIAKLKQIKDY